MPHIVCPILDVAKWKPEKPCQLGFDAAIRKFTAKLDRSKAFDFAPRFELQVASRIQIAAGVEYAEGKGIILGIPILVSALDIFNFWVFDGEGGAQSGCGVENVDFFELRIYMDALFNEEPSDEWLEKQGFTRDRGREKELEEK